jgi:WD40 repeat protein
LIDNKTLATGGFDNKLYVFSINTGRVVEAVVAHDDVVTCCEYFDSSNVLVSGSWDALVKVWDVRSNKVRPSFVYDDHEE